MTEARGLIPPPDLFQVDRAIPGVLIRDPLTAVTIAQANPHHEEVMGWMADAQTYFERTDTAQFQEAQRVLGESTDHGVTTISPFDLLKSVPSQLTFLHTNKQTHLARFALGNGVALKQTSIPPIVAGLNHLTGTYAKKMEGCRLFLANAGPKDADRIQSVNTQLSNESNRRNYALAITDELMACYEILQEI